MAFLDNVLNKSIPQGSSLAKPLMLAFTALLASGALGRKQEPASAPTTSPASANAGGLLGGLGGLLEKLQQSGHGEVTYYRWRQEFGGLKSEQVKRLKDLELENSRLRKAVSDLTLDKLILQEAARGNF